MIRSSVVCCHFTSYFMLIKVNIHVLVSVDLLAVSLHLHVKHKFLTTGQGIPPSLLWYVHIDVA